MDGEAAQLGVRRIVAGRRAVAGAADGGDSARLGSHELEEREGTVGTGSFKCDREDKIGARTTRITGGRDAWRRSPTADAGMGGHSGYPVANSELI